MNAARRQHLALVFLRIFLAAVMVIHGAARIKAGGVAPFGQFLAGQGFPLGFYAAWAITIFEIAGGIILAAGFFVPVLALLFAAQLVAGIILVHAREGWFVVGLGRNGMEYSVLLIAAFLAIAFSHFGTSRK